MDKNVRKYLSSIGRRGGQKSRRALSSRQARDMVRLREARKAFQRYHAHCFWSYDPEYNITLRDIPWVVEQLTKHGGHLQWELANRLILSHCSE